VAASLELRWGAFTCVRWQVTLYEFIWQVTLRSSEMGFLTHSLSFLTIFFSCFSLLRCLAKCRSRSLAVFNKNFILGSAKVARF